MSVSVKMDFRSAVASIRNKARDKVVRSVTEPGVKTNIYDAIWNAMSDDGYIPIDTGALSMSPASPSPDYFGTSNKRPSNTDEHYAYGKIDDKGMLFDPYTISKKGDETHYASYVRGFYPYRWINSNISDVKDIIRDIIVEEANN